MSVDRETTIDDLKDLINDVAKDMNFGFKKIDEKFEERLDKVHEDIRILNNNTYAIMRTLKKAFSEEIIQQEEFLKR